MRGAALLASALAALALAGCRGLGRAQALPAYWPDRFAYYAFRAAHPDLVEPNYLPFMVHPVPLGGGRGHALVFCHWERERFPLPVYVEPPEIPEALQREFSPVAPRAYVAAVEAALDGWERELEGLVRFRRVSRARDAALRVRLLGEVAPAPEPSVSVLGRIRLGRACRVRGPAGEDRIEVEFEAEELRLYVADEHGLLNPDQVERVALHELGHALGMRGHSPVPVDLMFPTARDNPLVRGPSEEDVNSFVSLYNVPSGTIFVRLEPGHGGAREERPPGPPPGPPLLAAAPHVDARFGYELRIPEGWQRLESERGMIAADGLAWDYDATFQVIVRGYGTVAEYLERYGALHVGAGRLVEHTRLEVAGRPALRMRVVGRAGPMVEELTFVEVGDGRVIVVIADCPSAAYEAYRPWFAAALASLEIRSLAPRHPQPAPWPGGR